MRWSDSRDQHEVHGHGMAEGSHELVPIGKGRLAGKVGARGRHGPHPAEQGRSEREVRYSQGDRVAPFPQFPRPRTPGPGKHHRQGPGPERRGQASGPIVGNSQFPGRFGLCHQHGQIEAVGPPLRREHPLRRRRLVRAAGDPVDGLRWEDHEQALRQRPGSSRKGSRGSRRMLRIDLEDLAHRAGVRPRTTRSRPARSGTTSARSRRASNNART
jgi:hypothetical protein